MGVTELKIKEREKNPLKGVEDAFVKWGRCGGGGGITFEKGVN